MLTERKMERTNGMTTWSKADPNPFQTHKPPARNMWNDCWLYKQIHVWIAEHLTYLDVLIDDINEKQLLKNTFFFLRFY